MPVGDMVTTVKFNIMTNATAIHNGVAVGYVNDPKGCRTKFAVEVPDAQRLLGNWTRMSPAGTKSRATVASAGPL